MLHSEALLEHSIFNFINLVIFSRRHLKHRLYEATFTRSTRKSEDLPPSSAIETHSLLIIINESYISLIRSICHGSVSFTYVLGFGTRSATIRLYFLLHFLGFLNGYFRSCHIHVSYTRFGSVKFARTGISLGKMGFVLTGSQAVPSLDRYYNRLIWEVSLWPWL